MGVLSGTAAAGRSAYNTYIGRGRESRLFALIGFLVMFPVARGVPIYLLLTGSDMHWSAGDLHIHHMVLGLPAMLLGGAIALDGLSRKVGGLVFGAGSALVLDDFSLMLYVDARAYWPIYGLLTSLIAIAAFAIVLLVVLLLGRPVVGRLVSNVLALRARET